jgi:hypothetical protein
VQVADSELQLGNLFHCLHIHHLQIQQKVLAQMPSPAELHLANLFEGHETVQSFGEEVEQQMDLQVGSMEVVGPLQEDKIVGIGKGTVEGTVYIDSLLLDYNHLDSLQDRP